MSIKEISPGIFVSEHSIFAVTKMENPAAVKAKPTKIFIDKNNIDTEKIDKIEIVSWGEDNDRPQKTLKLIKKIGVAGKVVQVATAAHFGTGLTLYEEDDEGKKQQIPYKRIPAFKDFDKRNNLNLYFSEAINDLEIHDMMFSEFILSNDYSKIVKVKRQQPVHCRFVAMDKKSGKIEKIAVCGDWENADKKSVELVDAFSQYDYYEDIREECKRRKIHKFIVPFHYVKNGEVFYNQPFWHAPLYNGWAELILSVPEVKNLIANNQLQFKYLILISEDYFKNAFGMNENGGYAWDEFSPDEQKKKQKELKQAIDDHMSGKPAAGRSMYAPMFLGNDGKLVDSIKIIPIEDKLKDGSFLPDASAGNYEIAFAKGVDPSVIGAGIPGGSNLSGSGSDKREAYTILCANMVINRTVSLLPFYLLRDWNNWGEDLDAGFPNVILTTLDKETSGQTEVIN